MKKMIITSMAVAALLLTNAQADFDFGNIFKDMKDAAMSMSKDSKDSTASMKDGTSVKVSDDIKTAEVSASTDTKDSTIKCGKKS